MAHMAPDFVTTNGIKCRTCDGGVMDVTDKDPRANSVAVSFAFGDLQDDSSSPGFPDVTEYQVRITDSQGRVNMAAEPLAVIQPQSNSGCCKSMAYRVKLTSGMAAGQRIALTAKFGDVVLPPFQFSAAITDDSGAGKQATVSRGQFTLTMNDEASLNAIAKPEGKEVFAAAFADSINLPRESVFITAISKSTDGGANWTRVDVARSRRLAAHGGSTNYQVRVDYTVISPGADGAAVPDVTTMTDFGTKMKANVKAQAREQLSVAVTVADVSATAPSSEVQGTPPDATAGAAGVFFSLFTAIFAVGAHMVL